jgi:proteasome accessory factor B
VARGEEDKKKTARKTVAGKTATEKSSEKGGRDDRGKRLLDLVVLLLGARSPVPFREMKQQFRAYRTEKDHAGLRAFERDKADLLELGVPLRYVNPDEDDSVDEPGYIIDLRRYRLPEIHLTPAEVAALVLAGSVAGAAAGTTYADVVDLALKKLAFDQPLPDTPGSPVRRTEPVLVHFPRPKEAGQLGERLAQLEQAVSHHKRLQLAYTSSSSATPVERAVDPYGLFYRQGVWVLVGYCHLRNDVRTFRLDRMVELEVAPKPKTPDFERPKDFDVRRYAARSPWTFESEPPVEVELEVRPEAGAIAHEDFGDDVRREELPGGGVKVVFRCANPEYVVARVLAAKGGLVVRAPAALRARAHEELRRVLGKYRA